MLYQLQDKDSTGTDSVRQAGAYPSWVLLHIQVQGPGTLRLGQSAQELQNPALEGLQINQGMGIVSLWWIGPLWVTASAPGALAVIETMTGTPFGGAS